MKRQERRFWVRGIVYTKVLRNDEKRSMDEASWTVVQGLLELDGRSWWEGRTRKVGMVSLVERNARDRELLLIFLNQ